MDRDRRVQALDAALDALREGDSITLDSTAVRTGITKPGLMYYFPTKEALMLALIEHVAQRWEAQMSTHLPCALADAQQLDKIRAYVDFAFTADFDETDILMLSDPRLRESLSQRWVELLAPWVTPPHHVSATRRSNILAARLMADGQWIASSTGFFEQDLQVRQQIHLIALDLLTS